MTTKRVRPFFCGTQADEWDATNCERCAKRDHCDIRDAINIAYWDDGTVSDEIAHRMGFIHDDGSREERDCWPCGEVEWSEEWKAECIRLHPERFGAEASQ